ncbi:MAG: hypothetical protein B7Y80_07565 [Hyphomicrobium sp. 32-62-53]|nr:MAG: hypothetical protein B7Y80_07565 [Hyphomicrobium sp. 32-62-53]
MFSGLRVSTTLFLVTGVVLLLQLFPLTGVFLMLFAAPFWSVLTLNLAFLALAAETLLGRADRRWLIAPLIWFGGYAVYAHLTHERYLALDARLKAENAAQSIVYDPVQQVLVFDDRSEDLSGAPRTFVQQYALPVAYVSNDNFEPAQHLGYRLADAETCNRLQSERGSLPSGISASWIHESSNGERKLRKDVCIVQMPEDPSRPALHVAATREAQKGQLLPHSLTTTTISDGLGGMAILTTGHAEILGWLPMPVMGCALNSGAPSWDCFFGFHRKAVGLGGNGAYGGATVAAIADVLKLTGRRTPSLSAAASEGRNAVGQALANSQSARYNRALANLDAAIAGVERRLTVHDVSGLIANPKIALARSSAIGPAIARDVAGPPARYETARVMQSIVAYFPHPQFSGIARPLLPELLPLVERGDWVVADDFAMRLGDLGPEALPVLHALANSKNKSSPVVHVYGVCRVGRDAASAGERLLALLPAGETARRDRDLEIAVYVALKRLGRTDLIEREAAAPPPRRFEGIHADILKRDIGPESPRSTCSGRWPLSRRLPD